MRTRWAALVAAALLLTIVSVPTSAATPTSPNRFVSGWIPYWQTTSGGAVISNASSSPLLSEVSLFGSTTKLDALVGTAHAAGLPVFQTLFSSSTAGFMTAAARTTTVKAIVDGAVAGKYDGVDIDYEFVWSVKKEDWGTITPQWVAFVKSLSTALHARGKLLSVTVPPVWDSGSRGYTVYAQPQIAPYVDRLRLMVYDWSITNPGPIAPNFWVKQVIEYSTAIAKVPPKKLQLGVPAYGRHWWTKQSASETCPDGALKPVDSITMRETSGLASLHGVTPVRHSSGELTFSWTERVTGSTKLPPPYVAPTTHVGTVRTAAAATGLKPAVRLGTTRTVTCTVKHVVFVPDATTVRTNAQTALTAGWSGIAVWAFGYETAALYAQLNTIAPQRPNTAPAITLDAPTATAGKLRVTGTAIDGRFDLPVPVRITATRIGTSTVIPHTTVANVSRAGLPASIGPFHGFAQTFTLTAGSYRVCASMLLWGGVAGPPAATCPTVTVP